MLEDFIFHRWGWDYWMKSEKTLWDELCANLYEGTQQAVMQKTWQSLEGKIDRRRIAKWSSV